MIISTEEAEALALWECGRGPRPAIMDALMETRLGPIGALALWIVHQAPVVRAAEAQTDASPVTDSIDVAVAQGLVSGDWARATNATEDAVRTARADVGNTG